MIKLKLILTLTLTILSALVVSGQQLIKCDETKSYWTFEKENSFFAVKLLGKVTEQERKNVIGVNNYVLQYVIVDKKQYIKSDSIYTDLKLLTKYALLEAEYMTGLFKQKLNIQMQKAPLSKEKMALIWFFEMPTSVSQEVKHQIFVNTIVGDKIFGLSSSQFANQKLNDVKDFLLDVISTLKQIDNRNAFVKLCEQ